MKMVKSLILGSAAGLVAMSGAQAADLPVKAKAVEYVRICSLYGAGFFYIPGTDTCIKLGGYLRVDTTFNGGIYGQPRLVGDLGQGNRYRDYFASRSRMALTVDTRTATEYGVVRTFGQGDFQFRHLGNSTQPEHALTGQPSATTPTCSTAQAAVMSRSKWCSSSSLASPSVSRLRPTQRRGMVIRATTTSFLIGGHDTVTGVNNIQYTAQFGNGVSGTIGLDDPTVFHRTAIYNLSIGVPATGTGATVNAYGGVHAPDIVGNIRVDQAWGLFQISGAAHHVTPPTTS